MDTAQWPQDIVVKPMEEIVVTTKPAPLERKARPQKEQALNCPRCNSTNTKFCYYNNYSLSQPRYFCKTCRRYWTEGGSLRNIPVGGGSRKNKRSSISSSTTTNSSSSTTTPSISSISPATISSKKLPDLVAPLMIPQQNPKSNIQENQDLNLGFSTSHDFKTITELIQVPNFETSTKDLQNPSSSSSAAASSHHLSALELLSGITTTVSRGLNSFIPMPPITSSTHDPNPVYSSGFPLPPEFKPSLNFSLDGLGSSNNYGTTTFQGVQETTGKLLFPFQGLKQASSTTDDAQQTRDQHGDHSTGYWNGVIGGGPW